jgi:hypothetical protein
MGRGLAIGVPPITPGQSSQMGASPPPSGARGRHA